MMGEPSVEAIAQDTLESLGKFGEQGQKIPQLTGIMVDPLERTRIKEI